jgi:hypothetical protein
VEEWRSRGVVGEWCTQGEVILILGGATSEPGTVAGSHTRGEAEEKKEEGLLPGQIMSSTTQHRPRDNTLHKTIGTTGNCKQATVINIMQATIRGNFHTRSLRTLPVFKVYKEYLVLAPNVAPTATPIRQA